MTSDGPVAPPGPDEVAPPIPPASPFGNRSWPGRPRHPDGLTRHTLPEGSGLPDERAEDEPPRPGLHESRFQLQPLIETQWRTDPSFDFFSEDDATTLGGLAAGYAVLSTPDWALVPELGWGRTEVSRDSLFGGGIQETTFVADRFHAGVSVRYALASFFEPHARLAAGLDATRLTLVAPGTPELVQDDVAAFGSIGAGATFHTNPGALSRRGVTRTLLLGLTVEGGYALSPDLKVNPKPDGKAPRVSTSDTALGSLSGSGPYLRVAATFRL
jgi:hypothetical protein